MTDTYSVNDLLALTGQSHADNCEYDKVISVWLRREGQEEACYPIGALGSKGDKIVDLGGLPNYRRKGIARLLVDQSECELTSAVTQEAIQFWKGIGWIDICDTMIIDTWVKQFQRPP